ncbi:hypothetical protein DO021_01770 [Desulfobacter hydrogenophilus]|jgi:hypothetical protein|uniref:Uncharacterized protein n=1 Tax=Desulfobacter hydrogenophilus TaxID=2291 RepID=A0A328FKP4_9BACT|nr:hypothetical protein DO021_01770 [Desulfobacter hydrogenophilus]
MTKAGNSPMTRTIGFKEEARPWKKTVRRWEESRGHVGAGLRPALVETSVVIISCAYSLLQMQQKACLRN